MVENLAKDWEGKESQEVNLLNEADFLIFDWDGVLFDSMPRTYLAVSWLIKKWGDPAKTGHITPEFVADTYDMPVFEYLKQFGVPCETDYEREVVTRDFRENQMEKTKEVMPEDDRIFPEVIETIKALATTKKLGIITAGNPAKVEELLIKHNLRQYFDFVVGSGMGKEEAIRTAVEKGGIKPERAVYFGDIPADIRDSKGSQSGIKSVAVARTPAAVKRLEETNPDYLVTGISENNLKHARKYD